MKIDAIKRISREDLGGAPSDDWIDKLLDPVNSVSENVVQALRGNLGFTDNTNSGFKEVDLTHATETRVANPLKVRPKGIIAVRALELSAGMPTGAPIENPRIKWRNADNGDVFITAIYNADQLSTGQIGEKKGPVSRVASAGLSLTSSTSTLIGNGATSITLTPGQWNVRWSLGFLPANTTTVTRVFGGASIDGTPAVPATDSSAVPGSNGEGRQELTLAGVTFNGSSRVTMSMAYDYTATTNTTLYLVAQAIFAVSTLTAFGFLEATRTAPYLTGATARTTLFFFGD